MNPRLRLAIEGQGRVVAEDSIERDQARHQPA
jgi:hypothetical protein